MPQDTPRGYTYPCFSDPVDFPAQLQELAEDVDADIQSIVDNIDDALDTPPSLRITGSVGIVIPANTLQIATFDTEVYDNNGMFPGAGNTVTVNIEGLYMISALATFDTLTGVRRVDIRVSGSVRATNIRQRSGATTAISVGTETMTYVAAGQTVQVGLNSSVGSTVTTRQLTMTRMTGNTAL